MTSLLISFALLAMSIVLVLQQITQVRQARLLSSLQRYIKSIKHQLIQMQNDDTERQQQRRVLTLMLKKPSPKK